MRFPCYWARWERAFPSEIVRLGGDGQDELAAPASLVLSLPLVSFLLPLGRGLHTFLEGGSGTDEG